MVWVQGGAYAFGMSGLPEYDGSTLARAGVVLVTFNYRVGLEGFGHVEGVPANPSAPPSWESNPPSCPRWTRGSSLKHVTRSPRGSGS
ncbi:carboxylesterase family protein [Terrabacter carboxydivorans]